MTQAHEIPLAGCGDPALALVQARHGLFLCSRRDLVGRTLFDYGEWAEPEFALLRQMLRPGEVVIEVGANIGTLTIPMARAVGPEGQCFAVEAQPYMYRLLNANAALNGIANLRAINAAAGNEHGFIEIPPVDYGRQGNHSAMTLTRAQRHGEGAANRVPMIRLDDAFSALERISLIKLDVEGMEPPVLAGATQLIARHRPVIYCEVNWPETFAACKAFLEGVGYDPYWHPVPGFNPDNFRGLTNNIFGAGGDLNLLALPTERGAVVQGLHKAGAFEEMFRLFPGLRGRIVAKPS